jgi:hypothetical protein
MQIVPKYENPEIFQFGPNLKIETGPGFWGLGHCLREVKILT